MPLPPKKRAPSPKYISPSQTILPGFESPFNQKLDASNRWIELAKKIPWDKIAGIYNKQMTGSAEGRPPLSARLVLGALMIKHLNNWSDQETILQIQENMYLQYFIGYQSFTTAPAFDPSLFVGIRKRLGEQELIAINEEIVKLYMPLPPKSEVKPLAEELSLQQEDPNQENGEAPTEIASPKEPAKVTNFGTMITDATVAPQHIGYPTDLDLLSVAREKTEELIDFTFDSSIHAIKPRTYRNVARKEYLKVAQNKNKSKKVIRRAVGKQLRFVRRNLKNLNFLLDAFPTNQLSFPLNPLQQKYLMVIHTLYEQQSTMHQNYSHKVEDRIVSIHQPHVRPIVRGKTNAKVEFGAKIEVTLVNGFAFLDDLSWDAYNEGSRLMAYVNKYRVRFGYYPKEILADKIYCNRDNRRQLKELHINLIAKPLGRPSLAVKKEYIRPGERNPIEGKFGQGKSAYGLNKIKARLAQTSQSWIASIILVLNLVKLAGVGTLCLLRNELILMMDIITYYMNKPTRKNYVLYNA